MKFTYRSVENILRAIVSVVIILFHDEITNLGHQLPKGKIVGVHVF